MPTDSENGRGNALDEELDWAAPKPEEEDSPKDELSEDLDWSARKATHEDAPGEDAEPEGDRDEGPEENDEKGALAVDEDGPGTEAAEDTDASADGEEGVLPRFFEGLKPETWHTVQVVGGWLFGFLIWFCLAMGAMNPSNELLNWMFLVVFLIAMLLRNYFEQRLGMSMRAFMKWLLVSLVVFMGVFLVLGPWLHVLPVNM